MSTYFVIIGLVHLVIGVLVANLFVHVFRKGFLGGFWASLAVGIIGSIGGGFANVLLKGAFADLSNPFGLVNLVPPLLLSFLAVWLYQRLSRPEDDQ